MSYECTVCGEGATLWSGSLFNCFSNEIILRHSRLENQSARGVCNNGSVFAQIIEQITYNDTYCYISKLNIAMSNTVSDANNKTIKCQHIVGALNETLVNETAVDFLTGIYIYTHKTLIILTKGVL